MKKKSTAKYPWLNFWSIGLVAKPSKMWYYITMRAATPLESVETLVSLFGGESGFLSFHSATKEKYLL